MNMNVHENGMWPSWMTPVAIMGGLITYSSLFCMATFSVSCTNYPDKYILHRTKWVPAVLLVKVWVTNCFRLIEV